MTNEISLAKMTFSNPVTTLDIPKDQNPSLAMPSTEQFPTVLCVACSSAVSKVVDQVLRYSQLRIVSAATREKGIAICLSMPIALAILDGRSLRGEECSLARSLKSVKPTLPIILLEERARLSELPDGVDIVVPLNAPEELLMRVEDLLNASGPKSRPA